ncbi:glucosidase [Rhizobium sp. VS19-DR104.2]|uniref:MGH1-like glycoside hydrolase domain-containing protein n=1 Tax=unclassified Rhizobium TaxID=2613769 RepID=UPI001CC5BDB4|nr:MULTISPECIES: glucosidase [unclassified Rhizobium]MBZ5762807.1 glucosidase [Rhizobium sp. VS19-DR96]MBZ5768042.1 glucosidase [Rhizobium sp. VS19-DR129.2]MBZ5775588.1 glucosidase [Rhizobium sp. VS19-DRK62.2]MBZ5787507.1 glucosidase [Rhizobium sp. VS19-DR121]MBZ5803968.1 glucosidase [Rhizobium sp. VS19-DR181]
MTTVDNAVLATAEGQRLQEIKRGVAWRRWGPYVSERQWGTVREDYSADGDAWNFFPFDHARSRAYRWGEDGLAGFCDESMRWCLGLALWNGKDSILKERLFGLANAEGNHGEDVKEVYHYVDATPTHSYQKMIYRYPQAAFPYGQLRSENAKRTRLDPEFEIADTGIFAEGRYFDVSIEYAKAEPDDILMHIVVENASDEAAVLHLLPQLWARNTWSWSDDPKRPRLEAQANGDVLATRAAKKTWRLSVDQPCELLFCENDTNSPLLFGSEASGRFKDGINDFVVSGVQSSVDRQSGSKVAARQIFEVPAKGRVSMRLRWREDGLSPEPFGDFDAIVELRRQEADAFYDAVQKDIAPQSARAVHRQAIAGLLWSKQFYFLDVPCWLDGDPNLPPPPAERRKARNADWRHLNNADIILMPDAWEYPWYAAWDLAFHCLPMALVDPDFAKQQLLLLTRDWFMHPSGQLPAYEWNFSDVNPPVQAWAALQVYEIDRKLTGIDDISFLERIMHKLMLNFTWWVNRKDSDGRNLFQGGFLGLDNISPFNRSEALPDNMVLDQADGTAWMAMYALNLMKIAIELALSDPVYEDMASKYFEHFLLIAGAVADIGETGEGLWNEEDGFFYDMLRHTDGSSVPIRIQSLVGLIPIFAVEVLDNDIFDKLPSFAARSRWLLQNRPKLASLVSRWTEHGEGESHLLSLLRGHRLKGLLRHMLDEKEFLSDFGVRSLSKIYGSNPYRFQAKGISIEVPYTPGEAESGLFGGNSNWRGPVWMPVNFLFIDALRKFHSYFGPDFLVECPTGSGVFMSLDGVADELSKRLARLFGPEAESGATPAGDSIQGYQLFYEYFHGDTGRGLGASHQTGWTALIANLISTTGQAR